LLSENEEDQEYNAFLDALEADREAREARGEFVAP